MFLVASGPGRFLEGKKNGLMQSVHACAKNSLACRTRIEYVNMQPRNGRIRLSIQVESGDIRYPHFSEDNQTDHTRPFFLPRKKRPGPEAIFLGATTRPPMQRVSIMKSKFVHAVRTRVYTVLYIDAQINNAPDFATPGTMDKDNATKPGATFTSATSTWRAVCVSEVQKIPRYIVVCAKSPALL